MGNLYSPGHIELCAHPQHGRLNDVRLAFISALLQWEALPGPAGGRRALASFGKTGYENHWNGKARSVV
jgi:hypothetical protein